MIGNLISIVTTITKAGILPIFYIWNLIATQWENETNNWED
jgi:hypothetical protein